MWGGLTLYILLAKATNDVATRPVRCLDNTRLFQAWEEDSRGFRFTELVVR
jgi:hypothetical protein